VAKRQNRYLGSSFDEFLRSEGLYEEVTTLAWKRVLSWEVTEAMRMQGISKSEMAKRMGTSRSQLERLLDPDNPNVLLETVQKAAVAVGKQLTIGLTDAHAQRNRSVGRCHSPAVPNTERAERNASSGSLPSPRRQAR
jgi:antitoxin HicB